MSNSLTLNPLFSRSVGFDRFNDLFESALRGDDTSSAYPPYNIEKLDDDEYRVTMAVAGFGEDDISIIVQGNELKVSGRIVEEAKEEDSEVEYLHRGIATRAFERSFSLADHVKVEDAELKDGLLKVSLKREIPEEAKPRMIAINGQHKMVEGKSSQKKKSN